MTVLEALADPRIFAPAFVPAEAWSAWRAFLAALFGLAMDAEQIETFRRHTGRDTPPSAAARECWVLAGRRGGKSRIAALVAVFLACFRNYSDVLAPGERGVVMVLAADRRQARVVLGYIRGLIDAVPMLARLVGGRGRAVEALHLSNRISIEVHTASFRTTRGYTIVAAILDEVAFWRDESSANPDVEIVNALRPGLASVPGSLLLGISSPYARRGILYASHRTHYGQEGGVLVWQAPTQAMNPTIPDSVIERAYQEDESAASAEYGAEFRRDIESFVSREAVDLVVVPGRRELPPIDGVHYFGFVDPSGGSADAMTLAIAHREQEHVILDLVRERRPPFSPQNVVEEFAAVLKGYRLDCVTGDRYGAGWVSERFQQAGIDYTPAPKPKSDLYHEFLPLVNSATVELLDHTRLIAQLCSLERRTSRGGRDTIDHPPSGHDDLVNATAGAMHLCSRPPQEPARLW
jgi:hypothetical protein